ncbi:MAG: ABC transporter ATP-binding protein [Chthoniobacterales bacterium]
MSVYGKSLRYLTPFWASSLGGLLLMFAAIAFSLLKPWPLKYLVDGVLTPASDPKVAASREFVSRWFGAETSSQIFWLCVVFIGINILLGLITLWQNYIFLGVGLRALLRVRTDLYTCLQSLPLKFHNMRRSTDSAYRVAYDSQAIQTIYNKGFSGMTNSLLMLIGTVAVMATMSWQLTLAALAIFPFLVFAIRYYSHRIRNQSTSIHERESEVLSQVQEGLSAVQMVHAFGREDHEVKQFQNRANESLLANLRLNITSVASSLVVGLLIALGTALLYYIGSHQVLENKLTLGDLTVFLSYLVLLYQPLEQITYTVWALEGAAAGAERCFEVLETENEIPDSPTATPLPAPRGDIKFDNVYFSYSEESQILKGIDLSIKPDETLAIVGGTGAGKSTLLSLIPRFYQPDKGNVRMDGHDIACVTKKSLRSHISLVLQDTLLFSTSIRENISYSRPDASNEEIVEAARRAQALDFIERLPDGFNSLVGERGSQLSVGQRQRIGIARAFLKDAPILLLDEPTSALDPTTEKAIMDALSDLMKGRTTIIVTHRLGTIHTLGKIAVLEHGKLVETGTGPELLAKGGHYAKLYQAGNYPEKAAGE